MKKIVCHAASTLIFFALVHYTAAAQTQKPPTLNHFALYILDLKKSTAFYKDMIGLEEIPEPFHDGKHTWFKIGEHSQLHIIEGAKEVTLHEMNTHLCFSISSVENFILRLDKSAMKYCNARGVPQTITTRADGVKQVYFQDPDNYWVEINDDKY